MAVTLNERLGNWFKRRRADIGVLGEVEYKRFCGSPSATFE
jgi:hypothetical protein